jgi:RNA binding exosome subunit
MTYKHSYVGYEDVDENAEHIKYQISGQLRHTVRRKISQHSTGDRRIFMRFLNKQILYVSTAKFVRHEDTPANVEMEENKLHS